MIFFLPKRSPPHRIGNPEREPLTPVCVRYNPPYCNIFRNRFLVDGFPPTRAPPMLKVNEQITIPTKELRFTYARSPGPGGQNVNKVNSKAILRWSMVQSEVIPAAVKYRFRKEYGNRINHEGDLILSSHRYRDQPRNANDCLMKLKAMILAVLAPPKPRKKTRVPQAVKRRRLENKRRNKEKKRLRSDVKRDD